MGSYSYSRLKLLQKWKILSLEEYTKVIVNASTVNPQLLEDIEEDIYQIMDKSKTIRIETEHPDSKKLLRLANEYC